MASMGLLRAFFSTAHTPTTIFGSVLGLPSSSARPGACGQSEHDAKDNPETVRPVMVAHMSPQHALAGRLGVTLPATEA